MPPRRSEDDIILKKLPFSTKKDVFLLKNQPFLRSPFSSKMYKNCVFFWWYWEKVVPSYPKLSTKNIVNDIQKAWEELKWVNLHKSDSSQITPKLGAILNCRYFLFPGDTSFFTKLSNTFYKAFQKVLEGFVTNFTRRCGMEHYSRRLHKNLIAGRMSFLFLGWVFWLIGCTIVTR